MSGKGNVVNSLTRIFQASTYSLLVLSALILAQAEGSALPAGVTLPIGILAWIFTERRKAFELPLWAANLLGMIGFVGSLSEMLSSNIESRLLSGAHLLVYLSWVVLFQPKQARQYWWMCALSMLQVAVGAVLTTAAGYGALLIGYFAAAIWTLSLFTLWQAERRVLPAAGGELLNPEPSAPVRDGQPAPGAESRFALLQAPSVARAAAGSGERERWLSSRFLVNSLATSAAAVGISAGFFVFIPRMWMGAPTFGAEATSGGAPAITGFSEKVRLGDIGRIMESTEPVLVMKLVEHPSGKPLTVEEYCRLMGWDEPYLRGAVLTEYSRGHWSAGSIHRRSEPVRTTPSRDEPRIRQDIVLQPIGSQILIAMHPVSELRLQGAREVTRFLANSVIISSERASTHLTSTYSVYSPLPGAEGPGLRRLSDLPRQLQKYIRGQLTQLPPAGVDQLAREARRVAGVTEDGIRPDDRTIADKLVHYLRDSGNYTYSLDASIKNPNLDPVEDFLFERKKGHCEYYATALALMLRAADIPARLVSGFKGGKSNGISGLYEVEQRHAHAWVEAYIDDNWEILDATPAAPRTESVESLEANLPTMRDLFGFFRDIWSQYVVNMNMAQQRERFYGPLQDATGDFWKSVKSGKHGGGGVLQAAWRFLTSPDEWFSWKGGLVSFVLLSFVAAIAWIASRLRALLRRMRSNRAGREGLQGRTVEFYERFRRLCASRGLERVESQTQREFGSDVEREWSPALAAGGLGGVPAGLSELFYRVRFGARDLETDELAQVDLQLTALERSPVDSLAGGGGAHRTNGAKASAAGSPAR